MGDGRVGHSSPCGKLHREDPTEKERGPRVAEGLAPLVSEPQGARAALAGMFAEAGFLLPAIQAGGCPDRAPRTPRPDG